MRETATNEGEPTRVWDVLSWDGMAALAEGMGPMSRLAYALIGSAQPDDDFLRFAKAYITGNPNNHPARRTRVTEMADAFGADRATLRRYLRSKGVIGPKD